jgi:predicted transcriptional regulator
MDTKTIIQRLGGTTRVAKLFKITPGAVSQWIDSNVIPSARLMYLHLARPDVFIDPTKHKGRKSKARKSKDPQPQ